jgi:hypothetical protein
MPWTQLCVRTCYGKRKSELLVLVWHVQWRCTYGRRVPSMRDRRGTFLRCMFMLHCLSAGLDEEQLGKCVAFALKTRATV